MAYLDVRSNSASSVQQQEKSKPARFNRAKAASLLASLGASKGGIARAKSLSPEARKTIASNAAKARWK